MSTSTRDTGITMICRLCSDTVPWGCYSRTACWQLRGSLVFDALKTEQGMSMLYNLSISTLRNKIRMQNRLRTAIAYSLYLYRHLATCTCKASRPHVFRYWVIPFYTRTPPMDDKISQSGFVQGTNETFVRGFFLNIGMCPGVKIAMSRGCYTEKTCV